MHVPTIARWSRFMLAALLSATLLACAKDDEGSSDSASTDDDDEEEVVLPPPSDSLMYVEAKRSNTLEFITHLSSDWNKRCTIDLSASLAERDINCVVEAKELDLYMNDLKMLYNVPQHERCTYLEIRPYWFWDREPGTGATAFAIRTLTTGDIVLTNDGGGLVRIVDGSPSCVYDHSSNKGSNCCTGEYTMTNVVDLEGGGTETQVSQGDWGGTAGACAVGPALQISGVAGDQAMPRYTIVPLKPLTGTPEDETGDGSTGTEGSPKILWPVPQAGPVTISSIITKAVARATGEIVISSPFSQDHGSNLYVANFVENPASLPAALSKAMFGRQPQLYYDFRCVNDAKEVYARIRLQVREWNLVSEFEKQGAGDPNTTGSEDEFTDQPRNDFSDWKDFQDATISYPGTAL